MKKVTAMMLCMLMLALPAAAAANSAKDISAALRPDYVIIIDDSKRTFYNADGQEVQPLVYNGTTYLPVRAIGEIMGKNVNWDEDTKTVTLSGTREGTTSGKEDQNAKKTEVNAQLRPDFTIVIDGAVRTFTDASKKTVYPVLYQGTVYLPVRAVGEIMGRTVAWDEDSKTVTLRKSGGTVTDADSFKPSGSAKPSEAAGSKEMIGLEAAKKIALDKVSGAASSNLRKIKLDYDDGRAKYEGEIIYQNKEYDFEIDAYTGEILEWDVDSWPDD